MTEATDGTAETDGEPALDEPSTGRASRRRRFALVGGAMAFCLALATHYEVLSYWFTGPDTLTLIETSRIRGTKSAIDTLTAPLMHGTNFVALTGKFYRPVASLSYAIDYWVWGLDPVGYHLTDLLAHATAAAFVVGLVAEQVEQAGPVVEQAVSGRERTGIEGRQRWSGSRGRTAGLVVAALAGGLFALHPLTAEVVPVPARRHDVLATVFVLASLWALARGLRATRSGQRLRYLLLALLAYALALGSKEVSVILPALAVSWTALDSYGRGGDPTSAIRETVLVGIGYALVSAAYLALRVRLLGGIGGYVGPFGGVKDTPVPVIVSQYFLSLFYPVDVLGFGDRVAYVPATIYVALAVVVALVLLGIEGAGGVRPFFRGRQGRLGVFYAIWLSLPLPLIVRVGEYSPWTGYISLVPVAALCALLATSAASVTYQGIAQLVGPTGWSGGTEETGRTDLGGRKDGASGSDGDEGASGTEDDAGSLRAGAGVAGGLATLAFASVLVLSLVAVSPLVHPYDGWEHAGEVTEEALTEAEGRVERLPPGAVVKVERLPAVTTLGPPTATPRVKSLRYFWAHSVRSWVHLRDPGSRLSTFTHGITTPVGNGSIDVRTRLQPRPNGPPVLRFRYEAQDESHGTNARGANEPSEPIRSIARPVLASSVARVPVGES